MSGLKPIDILGGGNRLYPAGGRRRRLDQDISTVLRREEACAGSACRPSSRHATRPDCTTDPLRLAVARPSYIRDTYDARYDFAPSDNAIHRTEYMLAAVPRSGSTYLAMELWRTGVMGAPMEYANPLFRNAMRARFKATDDLVAYWAEVKRHRTSPNGVFGFKSFIMDYVRGAHDRSGFLQRIAPEHVVLLTRKDLVAQAVSYSKAIRSGTWFDGVRAIGTAPYDAKHIWQCIAFLQYQLRFWAELFALTGTSVLHVSYEELIAIPAAVVQEVAAFLEVVVTPAAVIDLPRPKIQRDAESAEWIRRFRDEFGTAPELNCDMSYGVTMSPGVAV